MFQGNERLTDSRQLLAFFLQLSGFLEEELAFLGQNGALDVGKGTDDLLFEVLELLLQLGFQVGFLQ